MAEEHHLIQKVDSIPYTPCARKSFMFSCFDPEFSPPRAYLDRKQLLSSLQFSCGKPRNSFKLHPQYAPIFVPFFLVKFTQCFFCVHNQQSRPKDPFLGFRVWLLNLSERTERATRTDSVQKVCGGFWQGFDHLTKLESSKIEVVLQGGLRSSSTL